MKAAAGQASVELVAAGGALILIALVCLEALAVGYGAVMADHAAEAAALALANGRPPTEAARRAVPGWPGRAIRVRSGGGRVSVELIPPAPVPFLRRRLALTSDAAVRMPQVGG